MEFTTDDERQAWEQDRTGLYNEIQLLLAGRDINAAVPAIADTLAVLCVKWTGADRDLAHGMIDRLVGPMKRTADNSLDLVLEEIELARKRALAVAGNA